MAEFIFSRVIRLLTDTILSQLLGKDAKEEAESILGTLTSLRPILASAEEKQATSNEVKDWLQQLKNVVYDVEDVLEEFAVEKLRAKKEDGAEATKVSNFELQNEIVRKIKDLRENLRVVAILRNQFTFVVEDGSMIQNSHEQSRKTSSLVVRSEIYGREDDKGRLIELLLSSQSGGQHPEVIPIVGLGGLGKTTLSQLVYHSVEVTNRFPCRGWACVSETFDVQSITRALVESVLKESDSKQTCDFQEFDALCNTLKDLVVGKRFLLVLDDVWRVNENDWDLLCVPLKFGVRGSKIIVTTRDERIAKSIGTCPPFRLRVLSNDDCFKLFTRKALGRESFEEYPELEEVGKRIIHRCGGLPLAVKVLGGMLSSEKMLNQWEKVLGSPMWELSGGKDSILPVLRISYHHLPTALKLCFKYYALFPKDFEIGKDDLVELWLSERFILPEEGRDKEEIGREFLDELVTRSLLEGTKDYWGRMTKCKMHDLVHDLAMYVWKEEFVRGEEDGPLDISNQNIVRHASYEKSFNAIPKKGILDSIVNCEKLRTFLCLENKWRYYSNYGLLLNSKLNSPPLSCHLQLRKLHYLRVLSLLGLGIKELPSEIGCLKLLRYLNISGNPIRKLPDSICTLYNLEILLLERCEILQKLPERIWNLCNLQMLGMPNHRVSVPPGIGNLTKLRGMLCRFVLGSDDQGAKWHDTEVNGRISELKDMVELRGSMAVIGLENVASGEEAKEANMKNKRHLKKLSFIWSSRNLQEPSEAEEVLDSLQPHVYLQNLRIFGYHGVRLPCWLHNATLYKLEILDLCSLENCVCVQPLGYLPCLIKLTLREMNSLKIFGTEINCERDAASFPRLQVLTLIQLPNIEWLGLQDGDMPCLQKLHICNCRPVLSRYAPYFSSLKSLEMRGTSNIDDISSITSLTKVDISYCDNLTSLPSDFSNLKFLEKLTIRDCPQLASLPKDGLPKSLQRLAIRDCPLLEERCERDKGADWDKIAYIPHLDIIQ